MWVSAALLPIVLLIAWRTELALAPALGQTAIRELFLGFGLLSLAVAVPFLWRPLPWKRLLAYSSLEHMGILALGIGFGTPLAIEGLMAFFLESTFVGLFFFGWERLSKVKHLMVTWLVALGSNFSALWILVANGWMQYPVGAEFNPETLRMELTSFAEVFFSPVAQVKFVHTVSAGYTTGACFVQKDKRDGNATLPY